MMKTRHITFGDAFTSCARPAVTGDITVREAGYGWWFRDRSGEWALLVQWTTRQGGDTAWSVVLTEVDGDSAVRRGKTPTGTPTAEAVARAVNTLTRGWTVCPVRAFASQAVDR